MKDFCPTTDGPRKLADLTTEFDDSDAAGDRVSGGSLRGFVVIATPRSFWQLRGADKNKGNRRSFNG